jgi:lipoprotein NlpI
MANDPRASGDDEVARQLARSHARRMQDDLVLEASGVTSPIGRRMLVDRALQDTLLGEDGAAEADLGRVADDALTEPAAQYTRGLVLFSSGHFADAEKAFRASIDGADPAMGPARRWIGIAAYYDGRMADAVRSLREAAQDESGDERTTTLLWLFLAAQRQDHQGEAAITPFLADAQDKSATWPTQLLDTIRAFIESVAAGTLPPLDDLANWPPERALLEAMKNDPPKQRERAVQAAFFMSQLATYEGERGAAVGLLQLEARTHSTSVAEDLCARTELRRAGMKAPADLVDSARQAAAGGDRRGASAILQRAVAAAPDDAEPLLLLGRVENDQARCAGLEPLARAASLRPDDPVVGVEFARSVKLCGSRAKALAMLEHWLADPRIPAAARAEGLALRARARIDENDDSQLARSEDDAQAALRSNAGDPIAWQAMFYVHDHQDKLKEALEDVDRMKAAGAPPQDVAMYRGMALWRMGGRDAEAEAELTSSLAVEPGKYVALVTRTQVRLRRNDVEGALQDALALVEGWPGTADCWRHLKNAHKAASHAALARDALDHQIALQPGAASLWNERARLDRELNDHETALADFDKALAIDKSDAGNWIERANELWRLKRDTEAVASCLNGLELFDNPLNRSACAVIEWETGDHARAIETLDTLPSHRMDMETANEVYWFLQVGEALMSYGRAKEAVPFLRRSLRNRPDWPYGPLLLYLARALSGDEAAARAELAARPVKHLPPWPGHLVDYAARRLDDDALRRLATADAPGDFAAQACEATFYMGLRHWLEGDVTAGRTLLVRAADECPRTFVEAQFARAWLAAGPGLARDASALSGPSALAR